jgi:hypothetical protein
MHRKAALENVSSATIERKLMSTKTTLKRISLVAVAAMGFGLLSVVPSSATSQADTLTLSTATSSVTVGTAATTTLTQAFTGLGGDTMTVTASVSSAPTGNSTVPALTVNQASNTNASTSVSGGLVGTTTDTGSATAYNAASGVYTVTLPTTAIAGTYVIKFTAAVVSPNTGTVNAAAQTWTVTVAAEGPATSADSTWGLAAGTTGPTLGTHTAISTAKTVATSQAATILVNPLKSGGAALNAAIKLSATVSGPGTLVFGSSTSLGTSGTGRAITAGTAGQYYLGVFSDGTAGVATVTITEPGGAVLATATVNFADSLASYTLTPTNTITPDNGSDVVTIAGKDAAGTTAALGTYYLTSSNTAVATVPTSGTAGTFTVTGVGVGTSVITVANASSSPTITKTYTVTVGKHTIKTLSMTTDAASYASGGAVVVTVTALGSDGLPVGDGTYTAFSSAVTSNLAVQGTLPTSSIAFVGGKKTYTIYAPAQDGTVTLTGTEGSSTDNVIANGSTAAATITVAFDSVNAGSSAAVDAANAATDAANYAADAADAATTAAQEATAAAQAAQDSADAATAAVVALGLRVDTLMASVRAQLTSLSNLLVRIIKKTHA